MKKLRNLFDDYIIAARVMPAVTVVLPLLIILLYKGILKGGWTENSIEVILAMVFILFLANIARELGKTYERKMFKKLGALPTTIVMRFTDDTIDNITKVKVHEWFNREKGCSLPLSSQEEEGDNESDIKYTNATRQLRIYANEHRDELPRVYQELKKYHYWRNLYGCKICGLIIYIVVCVREYIMIDAFNLKDLVFNPAPQYIVFIGMIIWGLLWCTFVTRKNVKRCAFDYAVTLVEAICGFETIVN